MGDEVAAITQGRVQSAFGRVPEAVNPLAEAGTGDGTDAGLLVQGMSIRDYLLRQLPQGQAPAAQPGGILPGDLAFATPHLWETRRRLQAEPWRTPELLPGDIAYEKPIGGPFTVWAQGYHTELATEEGALDFEGDIQGAIAGFDYRLRSALLGLSISESEAELEFGGDEPGRYTALLRGVAPYIGWQLESGGHLWLSLGTGEGDVKITGEAGGSYQRDFDWRTLSFGGYAALLDRALAEREGARITAGLVSDLVFSKMEMEVGSEDLDTGRARLGMEADYSRPLVGASLFAASLEVTARHDFGDGLSGAGLEVGGGLSLALAPLGLKLDLAARTLLAHADEAEEWGLSGGMEWSSRSDSQGLSIAFRPEWGKTQSQSEQLWSQGLAWDAADGEGEAKAKAFRYALEVKYGLPVLKGRELLIITLHSDLYDKAGNLRLGAALNISDHLTATYEAATRAGAPPTHRARIHYHRPL